MERCIGFGMDQVEQWLGGIGLGEYAPRFAVNHVDFDLLPEICEQDLKDMGIASLGHRRRLLRAIAEVAGARERREQPDPAAAPAPAPIDDDGWAAGAERRNLTILFIDLADYASLASRLDPEDMGEIVRAYQACCTSVIADYDGFVAQYNADRVIASFGYPRAHEDEAERAVRAALDLHGKLAQLKLGDAVRARVGVATGLVVVGIVPGGPPDGSQSKQQWSMTGDAPNLAARLVPLAEPGSTVAAATTRQLLGELFELDDLGPQVLKGLREPVRAFAVRGERAWGSRFEARAGGLSSFVGRADEREQLLESKRLAWQGRGQAVLITGEPGIGKSRLSDWLVKKLPRRGSMRVRYQCTPHLRDSWLHPLTSQLERAARFAAGDKPEQRLKKLEEVLALAGPGALSSAPLFAALLRIPTGARYAPLALSPQQQRQRTMEAMLVQIEGLSKHQPVLVVCEDVQWADPTSLEVIDMLVERIARLPVLLLVTTRPEFSPAWAGRHNVSVIGLHRLDRRQTRAMVEGVSGAERLPVEVLEQIVAKTDGIPLFVEELTKSVLESGDPTEAEDGAGPPGAGPAPALAIPATLQDSLMARLDRSHQVREVAQIGAAIGREFAYNLLAAVTDMDEPAIQCALSKLEGAGLATRRGNPPEAIYTFKHALVQDAAHESLLKSRRQIVHRRIAEALRGRFAVLADTQPEIVAHHFAQANLMEEAVEWWTKAGELALRRSAYAEAIAHFEKAIGPADVLLREAGCDAARHRRRYRLQVVYANAQLSLRGYTGPEVAAAFRRCVELGTNIEDVIERFAGFYGVWAASFASGQALRSRELIESFVNGVGVLAPGQQTAVGRRILGLARWCSGDYEAAVPHLEAALSAYDPQRDLPLTFRFGQDIGASTMIKLAVAIWPMGKAIAARRWAERAVAHARDISHKQTLAFACCYKACFEAIRDDPARAGPDALATLEIGREHDLNVFWLGLATVLSGWARWRNQDEAGAAEMQEGLAILHSHGIGLYQPLYDALWAEVRAAQDRSAALFVLDEALATSARSGQTWFDAELHRRRAALVPQDGAEQRERCLGQSLAIARRQQARAFELRASLDLARLYRDTDREAQALDILRESLAGLEVTPELPEVAAARDLAASMGDLVPS